MIKTYYVIVHVFPSGEKEWYSEVDADGGMHKKILWTVSSERHARLFSTEEDAQEVAHLLDMHNKMSLQVEKVDIGG